VGTSGYEIISFKNPFGHMGESTKVSENIGLYAFRALGDASFAWQNSPRKAYQTALNAADRFNEGKEMSRLEKFIICLILIVVIIWIIAWLMPGSRVFPRLGFHT
jgi:hypothetical protein